MKKLLILLVFILIINTVSAYTIYYYHNDNQGNPVAITDEDSNIVWKAEYEPFGSIFNEEEIETSNKYNYNTKELDKNTDLLYYGNRYYDSNLGRFTTADTIKGSLDNPQSLNRYSYTLNNPLKYIDPSGNQGEKPIEKELWEQSNTQQASIFIADFGKSFSTYNLFGHKLFSKQGPKLITKATNILKEVFEEKGYDVNIFLYQQTNRNFEKYLEEMLEIKAIPFNKDLFIKEEKSLDKTIIIGHSIYYLPYFPEEPPQIQIRMSYEENGVYNYPLYENNNKIETYGCAIVKPDINYISQGISGEGFVIAAAMRRHVNYEQIVNWFTFNERQEYWWWRKNDIVWSNKFSF